MPRPSPEIPATVLHWPALDGLRGIAVVAVLFFHAVAAWFPNGFAGVEVFFGLSGFLITTLLLQELASNGRINLRNFYMRRVLRLIPALVVTCLAVVALGAIGGRFVEALLSAAAALFYYSHIWIATGNSSWFLGHTWTLSLEEHYYLIWPGLLWLFLARKIRFRIAGALVTTALLMLLAIPGFLPSSIQSVYERGAPMMYGSLGGLLWWRLRGTSFPPTLQWIGNISLLGVITLTFWPVEVPAEVMMGLTGLPGLLSVLVVLSFVIYPNSTGARLLTSRALRWTGRRAYGLYLYHVPILSLMRFQVDLGAPEWARVGIGIVITFFIGAFSYRWIEIPFLRMKSRFTARHSRVSA